MANHGADLETKLRKLRLAYAENLPAKIREITEIWTDLKATWQPKKAEEVYRYIHSICGSSASYGAAGVHSYARDLEQTVLATIYTEQAPTGKDQLVIDNLIARLSEATEEWVTATVASKGETESLYSGDVNPGRPRIDTATRNQNLKSDESEALASGTYRILYVEDNRANLNLVKQLVRSRWPNAELSMTDDPVAGLGLISENRYHIVLLDINLPVMNGYQVLARIRENLKYKDLPVVAVSANAMPDDVQSGLDAGFDDYITKPIQIDKFFATIERILLQNGSD